MQQHCDVRLLQWQRLGLGEQAAVEPLDVFKSEVATAAHGAEQFAQPRRELGGVALALIHQALEQLARQQFGVLGEQGEQAAVEKARHVLR